MPTLLWGLPRERPLAMVRMCLTSEGASVVMLDQHELGETALKLYVGDGISGAVRCGGRWVDLASIDAAYLRPYDSSRLPALRQEESGGPLHRHADWIEGAIWSWAEVTPALVVNRPQAMGANNSKPYQADIVRSHGFQTPETLLTTDPEAVREFWERHGEVVYKSISGVRSVVSRLRQEQVGRLENVASCPTQFQAYIPGVDHRVHVVADDVYVCEVRSDADDYRYPGSHHVELWSCDLPGKIRHRCVSMVQGMGLLVAGVDLRRTPDGEWYCFEVNPCPAFSYFERATGLPIARAIARLLLSAEH